MPWRLHYYSLRAVKEDEDYWSKCAMEGVRVIFGSVFGFSQLNVLDNISTFQLFEPPYPVLPSYAQAKIYIQAQQGLHLNLRHNL